MSNMFRIFVINPGSTSTRVAYYKNDRAIYDDKLVHPDEVIAQFKEINDQLEMRKAMVFDWIMEKGITDIDAVVSRGGGGRALRSGGYLITPLMVQECKNAAWPHASNMGCMIGYELMQFFNVPGYTYDSPSSDDFNDYAKVSGHPELPCLRGAGHPLNQKSAGHKVAAKLGGRFEDYNFIISHLGGGITVGAYQKGKIIDNCTNAFTPQRSGVLPMIAFTRMCFSGRYSFEQVFKMQMGEGGLVAYLGTSDIVEIERRIDSGDQKAAFYFEAMVYQIAKDIGAMATPMNGEVDRIILTGEIAHSKRLTDSLIKRVSFIAPVEVIPGAREMEALVAGVLRLLRGQEPIKDYDIEQA